MFTILEASKQPIWVKLILQRNNQQKPNNSIEIKREVKERNSNCENRRCINWNFSQKKLNTRLISISRRLTKEDHLFHRQVTTQIIWISMLLHLLNLFDQNSIWTPASSIPILHTEIILAVHKLSITLKTLQLEKLMKVQSRCFQTQPKCKEQRVIIKITKDQRKTSERD